MNFVQWIIVIAFIMYIVIIVHLFMKFLSFAALYVYWQSPDKMQQ
ncbi:MAG: hypothetical protein PHY57_12590 [Ignavibacterium sp.]|nr:hypothetical protein [Ignavibacterium sp.]